jgi:MFS family permease
LKYYLTREPLPFIHIFFFFIDSDYGGTVVTDDSNLTEMPYEESVPERNCHVPPTIESDVTMDMSLPMDIPHSQLDQPTGAESLENPTYTDSLSSNDSAAAFIYRDQNKIWAQTEVELDEDENADVKLLENPAYIDSVTSKESQLISLLKPEYQDDNDDSMSVHESIVDESQGRRKEFEVSIVEIVPHISPSLQTEPLWESTAYIDEFTCPSPSTRRLERVCKQAILNLSQDISCKGSMKGSTLLPVLINQVPEPVQVDEESFFEGNEIKNLLVISVSVSMMNVAFSSLRNLQSSLNHEDGVGLYSLTGSCGAFTFMSLFTPSLIQQFRPKRCLLFALFTHLLYVAANVIPDFAVLVPASILQGGGSALMWNAVSTYVTYLARSTAIRNDKRTVDVAGKYFGVFFCFFQLSVVVGNLISSVVLKQTNNILNNTISIDIDNHDKLNYQTGYVLDDSIARNIPFSNMSKYDLGICGSKYCHSYPIEHETLDFEVNARYNLLGIYGVSTVLSLILPMFLLDSLRNYRTSRVSCKHVAKQASSVLRCIMEPRFLSCLVMFLYSNMELGFVMAEVTKVSNVRIYVH